MSSNARGYKWPPFENGHTLTVKHGARSDRQVSARAAEVHVALVEMCPWIDDSMDAGAIERYTRAEARASLLNAYIMRLAEDDPARVPVTLWGEATRADTTSAQLAGALGLDPSSRARLLKDMGIATRATAEASSLRDLMARGARAREAATTRLGAQNTSENASGVVDAPSGHSDDSATSLRPMRRVGGGARATSTAEHED